MIKKLLIFIKSDGIKNTMHFVFNAIRGAFGAKSSTLCLYMIADEIPDAKRQDEVSLRVIKDVDALNKVDFPRLSLQPCAKWLNEGGECHVLFRGASPVAYGWTHYKSHEIDKVGRVPLDDDKAWLGPYFVLNKERGHGFQKVLITECMRYAMNKGVNCFLTSVNMNNEPSKKSFERLGFKYACLCQYKKGQNEISYYNQDAEKIFKIQ